MLPSNVLDFPHNMQYSLFLNKVIQNLPWQSCLMMTIAHPPYELIYIPTSSSSRTSSCCRRIARRNALFQHFSLKNHLGNQGIPPLHHIYKLQLHHHAIPYHHFFMQLKGFHHESITECHVHPACTGFLDGLLDSKCHYTPWAQRHRRGCQRAPNVAACSRAGGQNGHEHCFFLLLAPNKTTRTIEGPLNVKL